MNAQNVQQRRITRSFRDLSDEFGSPVEQASILFKMGWKGSIGWSELLGSQRVLLVSEAGVGKTHECRAERDALWEAGEPAFLIELAELSRNNLVDLFGPDERVRFDACSLLSQMSPHSFWIPLMS